jgi:hypothetical protein
VPFCGYNSKLVVIPFEIVRAFSNISKVDPEFPAAIGKRGERLRRLVIVFGVLALVGWGAWRLYQHPQVQDLFYGSGKAVGPRSVWKIKTQDRPAAGHTQDMAKSSGATAQREKTTAPPAEARKQESPAVELAATEPPAQNSVANDVVTRVVLQILYSRKLVSGVAISTSDTAIIVEGIVDSEEKRQQILAIVDKAREARRVDSRNLIVEPKK